MKMSFLLCNLLFFSQVSFAFTSVCERSEIVKISLEHILAKPCEQIDVEDLNKIHSLNLQSKNIRTLKAGDFDDLSNLRTLLLSKNKLERLPNGIFQNLSSLESLGLDENPLKELRRNYFGDHPKLSFLHLSLDQKDLKVDRRWFGNNKSILRTLHLYNVKYMPDNLLKGLSNVYFINLELKDESIGEFDYRILRHLRVSHLAIFAQKLKTLPHDFFWYIKHTPKITAFLNGLQNIHPLTFMRNRQLRYLSLSFGALIELPMSLFRNNKKLDTLSVSSFQDTSLTISTDMISHLKKLRKLVFVGSAFASVEEGILNGLNELEEFQIYYTNIKSLPTDLIYTLPKFKRLLLQSNKLQYIDPEMINPDKISKTIEAVYVAFNQISKDNLEALKRMLPGKIIL